MLEAGSMAFAFKPDLTPDFRISLEERPDRWVISCTGILDVANAAAVLQPELLRLHAAAIAAKLERVEVRLQDAEYMNSSGLKAFMAWFLTAANEKQGKYRIEVHVDPARSWQHTSFRPMERLAPNTVTLVSAADEGGKRA